MGSIMRYLAIFYVFFIPFIFAQSCGPTEIQARRVVGYWQGIRNLAPTQVQSMTHIIYAFVQVHPNGSVIPVNYDITRFNWAQQAKSASNPNLKIMFSIGGENSPYISPILNNSASFNVFVSSIVNVIHTYGLDGVDIDWEFPASAADRSNYVVLMQQLCSALQNLQTSLNRPNRYILSFTGGYDFFNLQQYYDLADMVKYVDFINVMTYDYYAAWNGPQGCITGPPAQLYGGANANTLSQNVNTTMNYYACVTLQVQKINLGIPFYGRYWNYVGGPLLLDPMYRQAQSPSGPTGNCVGNGIAWRDIPTNWSLSDAVFHPTGLVPYIYYNTSTLTPINGVNGRFLGFENPASIGYKGDYAKNFNIGGLMVWNIDQDDSSFQMIVAVAQKASQLSVDNAIKYNCVLPG